jgi:HEPN domain-containing protein
MKIDKPDHYFGASLERLRQAWTLYQEGNSYALAMYVAGVAVECMLRAFKMRKETTFDEKHDLERLFRASGMLKIDPELLKAKGLSEEQAQAHFRGLQAAMVDVCRLWANDYRYASEARMRVHLKQRKLDRGVKGDCLKAKALSLLNASQQVISKGVYQWNLLKRSKPS